MWATVTFAITLRRNQYFVSVSIDRDANELNGPMPGYRIE